MRDYTMSIVLAAVFCIAIIAVAIFRHGRPAAGSKQERPIQSKSCVIIGISLMILQIFGWVGATKSGSSLQLGFSNPKVFSFDIASFIGFNLVGIIGLVILIIGARKKK